MPDPMVDLAVGLEGAVSVNRFIKDKSSEGAPYRDFAQIGTKIVLTASDRDEATKTPVWYPRARGRRSADHRNAATPPRLQSATIFTLTENYVSRSPPFGPTIIGQS